jgi:two-component sensor histidine kinase
MELCTHLKGLSEAQDVSITTSCQRIELETRRAISVGLIVNELVTNSFKHASVTHQKGQITVSLAHSSDFELVIEDDGDGCPDGAPPGLGSRLVDALVGPTCWQILAHEYVIGLPGHGSISGIA